MDASVVLNQMVVLFLLMAAGYAANRFGVLDAQSNRLLSRLVLNLTMPALIASSLLGSGVQADAGEMLRVLGVSAL
ncbi:MAG: AEC family transporter, partial [Oscillospiraceae bacterium]